MPLPALLFVALLTATASCHAAMPDSGIHVVSGASANASVTSVRLVETAGGLQVSGWIERRFPTSGRLRGAVEVRLLDAEGGLLETTTEPLRTQNRIPRHQRLVAFSVTIPDPPKEARVIEVQPNTWGPAL